VKKEKFFTKHKIYLLLLLFTACFAAACFFPVSANAHADMGPKPSVVVDFEGISGTYYVTLLSKTKSSGPHRALPEEGEGRYQEDDKEYAAYIKFVEYRDEGNYYFLQFFGECSSSKNQFVWVYYPPTDFKILIYFPQEDCFAVSEQAYQTYAFHSYFKVNWTGGNNLSVEENRALATFAAQRNYNYGREILLFFSRLAITLALEMLLALLFGFRTKKPLLFIAAVNAATQLLLNIGLSVICYFDGLGFLFYVTYVLAELAIMVAEATVFAKFLPRKQEIKISKKRCVFYALFANILSFAAGLVLSLNF
jgi:hypothetical protein